MSRILISDGDEYLIECAVCGDGDTSPAAELLADLEKGTWQDPEADELPDEYQVKVHMRVLACLEYFANNGDFPRKGQRNYLNDGIWEIRDVNLRITFYDTDGQGGWDPKAPTDKTIFGDWEIPYFDTCIRLGHYFPKTGPKASPEDLQSAYAVREQDVAHDQ